jgi:nucleoside-diphosphate-sugar epimerase
VTTPPTTILFTGFPGFIGRRLIKALAQRDERAHFVLLVEERRIEAAESAVAALGAEVEGLEQRLELLTGDITDRLLGQPEEEAQALAARVTGIWHLAAIYDLAVAERLAYRVNVVGTINMLDFAERCAGLTAFHYVSTCYVSGDRVGLVREVELDEGQGFKNHYESTKFWAEVEVQRRAEKLPVVIYRPGVVVGDSRDGATDKYDGPYHVIRLLKRLPDGVPIPNIGNGDSVVNIIPVDFAIEALVTISANPAAVGQIFQIADPNPMRAGDIVALMLDQMGKAPSIGRVPAGLARLALKLRPLESALDLPRESLAYFNHDARYDTTNMAEILAESGVRCPHLSTYMDTLIHYVERHPNRPVG